MIIKKKSLLLSAVTFTILLLLSSCDKNESIISPIAKQEVINSFENVQPHICTEMTINYEHKNGAQYAAGLKSNEWNAGDIVKIKFLNPSWFFLVDM